MSKADYILEKLAQIDTATAAEPIPIQVPDTPESIANSAKTNNQQPIQNTPQVTKIPGGTSTFDPNTGQTRISTEFKTEGFDDAKAEFERTQDMDFDEKITDFKQKSKEKDKAEAKYMKENSLLDENQQQEFENMKKRYGL